MKRVWLGFGIWAGGTWDGKNTTTLTRSKVGNRWRLDYSFIFIKACSPGINHYINSFSSFSCTVLAKIINAYPLLASNAGYLPKEVLHAHIIHGLVSILLLHHGQTFEAV